jgi:hypothetical protein
MGGVEMKMMISTNIAHVFDDVLWRLGCAKRLGVRRCSAALARRTGWQTTAGADRSAAPKAAQQRTHSKAFGDCASRSLLSGSAGLGR